MYGEGIINMGLISDYNIEEKVYENSQNIIYKASRKEDNLSVLIKIFKNDSQKENVFERIKKEYENYHKVTLDNNILSKIVDLSDKYIKNRFFPDKAIDILDESCSRFVMTKEYKHFSKKRSPSASFVGYFSFWPIGISLSYNLTSF